MIWGHWHIVSRKKTQKNIKYFCPTRCWRYGLRWRVLIMCILHYRITATFDCCKTIITINISNSNGISSNSSSNITLNISGSKNIKTNLCLRYRNQHALILIFHFWFTYLLVNILSEPQTIQPHLRKPQFNLLMISSGQYVGGRLVRSEGQEWQNDWWPVKYDIMPVGSFIPAPRQWGHRCLLMTSSGFSEAASSTAPCSASPCSDNHPQPAIASCVCHAFFFFSF